MATDLHRPVTTPAPSPAGEPGAAVRAEGLTRAFDGRAVIDGLDLTLKAGGSPPCWDAAGAASPPCCGCWPGSTMR